MQAETLSAEEREALFKRCNAIVEGYYARMRALQAGAVLPPDETPKLPQQLVSDIGSLLSLARFASVSGVGVDSARAVQGSAQGWQTISTYEPEGRQIVVSAEGWEGVCTREWRDRQEMWRDLANWSGPPTHWQYAPSPPADGRRASTETSPEAKP